MPPAAFFEEKARTPLRSMTIVDLKFHGGEVFVAGVSNQEFSSTLRRIPLLNEEEQVVRDPFLVLSQELWSPDGRRLTVLMEPGRIKRGIGADPAHDPALVVGQRYSLVVTALGQTASYTFGVSDPVLEAVDETCWRLVCPACGEHRSRRGAVRQGYGRRPL